MVFVLFSYPCRTTGIADAVKSLNCSTPHNCTGLDEMLDSDRSFYVAVWGGLIALCAVLAITRGMVLRFVFLRSSASLHDSMLASVLKAPMLFFDTNPSGKIYTMIFFVYNIH